MRWSELEAGLPGRVVHVVELVDEAYGAEE